MFYCYHPDEALTTSYRPGFDAKFVDIVGEVYIDETCDFTNIVKLYSYPGEFNYFYLHGRKIRHNLSSCNIQVRVCGIPEAHHNQTIEPFANYYLISQQVTYRCSDDAHTLIGRPDRVCQQNGLWSGNTPICVLGILSTIAQDTLLLLIKNLSLAKSSQISTSNSTDPSHGKHGIVLASRSSRKCDASG